ncbi:hypothetical protein HYPSUDRAFT_919250 [Hypholoma sublateritium FD-334 SS-4]|uniref:Uncharacterized protein n=1 Tax=Hypholoma sublateritium (strain FD-334 SS-4) TaxID=945553 RepID=A0A0D2KVH2_HYPSF|nr:hypothetical protein HYPSUDRAFT_919250 [Hypholoma sublateritium FD-334 SS-4]
MQRSAQHTSRAHATLVPLFDDVDECTDHTTDAPRPLRARLPSQRRVGGPRALREAGRFPSRMKRSENCATRQWGARGAITRRTRGRRRYINASGPVAGRPRQVEVSPARWIYEGSMRWQGQASDVTERNTTKGLGRGRGETGSHAGGGTGLRRSFFAPQ